MPNARKAKSAPSKAAFNQSVPKTAFAFRRDRPDLPASFDQERNLDPFAATLAAVSIDDALLADVEQPGLALDQFEASGCVFERARFSAAVFSAAIWRDVRLANCDLANVRAHRAVLVRVELTDCRLSGFASKSVDFQDVLIDAGDLRYVALGRGKFRSCEFAGCNFQDADLSGADLSGCIFRGCNLERADLRGCTLANTDFRGSELDGMLIERDDLQGAIVDPPQAMIFARLLGLTIK